VWTRLVRRLYVPNVRATQEQIHRVVKRISIHMDAAARLPFSMSHKHLTRYADLLRKIKSCFPSDQYAIIKSHLLLERTFKVKYGGAVTQLKEINSEVPQGSVLCFIWLHSADLPVVRNNTTATYADDIAILAARDEIQKISGY